MAQSEPSFPRRRESVSTGGLTSARYGALGLFDEESGILQFLPHGVTQGERERIEDLLADLRKARPNDKIPVIVVLANRITRAQLRE